MYQAAEANNIEVVLRSVPDPVDEDIQVAAAKRDATDAELDEGAAHSNLPQFADRDKSSATTSGQTKKREASRQDSASLEFQQTSHGQGQATPIQSHCASCVYNQRQGRYSFTENSLLPRNYARTPSSPSKKEEW
ncbi:hypothetical protein LTR70_009289 [Exophiala xenobiotica]|nr:hypothetical protein LTR70_009289 [Exophiala xenobiotica]